MSKYKILLVCAAGMSTTQLVQSMSKAADKHGLTVDILAVSANEADQQILHDNSIDILLLGPQVRFLKDQFIEKVEHLGITVGTINMQDFGTVNGEKILLDALENFDTN